MKYMCASFKTHMLYWLHGWFYDSCVKHKLWKIAWAKQANTAHLCVNLTMSCTIDSSPLKLKLPFPKLFPTSSTIADNKHYQCYLVHLIKFVVLICILKFNHHTVTAPWLRLIHLCYLLYYVLSLYQLSKAF